jgi:plastocyanin
VSNGLFLSGPTPPMAVTFTAPQGLYWFHCRIHPYMTGAIRVVGNGQTGTSAAQADANAAAQVAFETKAALATEARYDRTASRRNADGTRTWTLTAGVATRNRRVSLLEFLPRNVDVRPGDTIVWRPLDPSEPHTATFPVDMHGDIVPLCEASAGTDVPAVPTVNPPTGPFDFACNGHPADELELDGGNGVSTIANTSTVSDSGVFATRQLTLGWGLPQTAALARWSVKFASNAPAGTYHYVCQIHDGMEATLTIH